MTKEEALKIAQEIETEASILEEINSSTSKCQQLNLTIEETFALIEDEIKYNPNHSIRKLLKEKLLRLVNECENY